MRLGAHTVVVVRRTRKDVYGDPGAGAAAETTVRGCYVQPPTTSAHIVTEQTDLRDTVTIVLIVYMPPGSDVVATDRIRWNGTEYNVADDPARWDDANGRPHHLEVKLRRVEG